MNKEGEKPKTEKTGKKMVRLIELESTTPTMSR